MNNVSIGEYNTLVNQYNDVYKENKKLKNQIENNIKVNMADHKYASECEDKVVTLEAHQKEFIKWLEDEMNKLVKEYGNYVYDDYSEEKGKYDTYIEVLKKYKKITGGNE